MEAMDELYVQAHGRWNVNEFWLLWALRLFSTYGEYGPSFVIYLKAIALQWPHFQYNRDPFYLSEW